MPHGAIEQSQSMLHDKALPDASPVTPAHRFGRTLDGVDFATSGISTEQQWVDAYRAGTGRAPIAGWNFLRAFSVFRLASISHGVHARSLAGTTPIAQAAGAATESGAAHLADMALNLLHRPA